MSGIVLFREQNGKVSWFITKHNEKNEWELPKVVVRKGESSVRAVIRIMGEKGGMTTRVLEEAGRTSATVTTDNKTSPQKTFFYLMMLRSGSSDTIGFGEYAWLEYPKAASRLTSKKEKSILKSAKELLKAWKKERKNHPEEEEEEEPIEITAQEGAE